jgi:hypothetical protein
VSPDLPRIWAKPENRLETNPIDDRKKIKLVSDALVKAQSDAFAGLLILQRTEENKLAQLDRNEIIWTLQSIQNSGGKLFQIQPDLSAWLNENAKPSMHTKHLDEHFGPKWRGLLEKGAIVLSLSNRFDNWCAAQRHKNSITLANLSLESRAKVFATVAAIYERFELTSDPKVTITWWSPNPTENYEARELSLEFLTNKDAVTQFNFQRGGIHIDVEIDVKEFFRLRDELLALYAPTTGGQGTPAESSTPVTSSNLFTAIPNLRWQDITIQFVNNHDVRVSAKTTAATVNFKEMGFEDARKGLPNTQWALLKILAENKGQINWGDSEAADNVKKKKQILSETLKAFFRIDDDPFYPYREEKTYRAKFTLKAEDD